MARRQSNLARGRGPRNRTPWGVGIALAEGDSTERGWHQSYSKHTTEAAALKAVPRLVERLKVSHVSVGFTVRDWRPIYIFVWNDNKPHPGKSYAYDVELHKFDLDGDDLLTRPEKVT